MNQIQTNFYFSLICLTILYFPLNYRLYDVKSYNLRVYVDNQTKTNKSNFKIKYLKTNSIDMDKFLNMITINIKILNVVVENFSTFCDYNFEHFFVINSLNHYIFIDI